MHVHQREAGDRPFDGAQSADIRTYLDTLLVSPGFRLPGRRERLLRYLGTAPWPAKRIALTNTRSEWTCSSGHPNSIRK
jgi:hypothetical protein